MRSFTERVVAVVEGLASGEVVSYGEVAAQAGRDGAARAVGNILAASSGLPWWRVVRADGRLAPGKEEQQAAHLREEGVEVVGGRVRRADRPG